jgi:hypothetical protein
MCAGLKREQYLQLGNPSTAITDESRSLGKFIRKLLFI